MFDKWIVFVNSMNVWLKFIFDFIKKNFKRRKCFLENNATLSRA